MDDLKREREELEQAYKNANPELKNAFCSALAREGRIDEAELSRRVLEATYGPILQRANGNLARQEKLVAEIQEANGEFTRGMQGQDSKNSREAMMKDFAAAYDAFMELKGNLKEGTDFYNDLTQVSGILRSVFVWNRLAAHAWTIDRVCVVGFSDFILLWFLPSFLSAGLGKQMQKPLDAHQERFVRRSKREHGCFF